MLFLFWHICVCYILFFITFDFFSWLFFLFFSLGISLGRLFLLDLPAYPWEFCVGRDVINAWDDIKFSFFLLVYG